jgi:hypothetical protein
VVKNHQDDQHCPQVVKEKRAGSIPGWDLSSVFSADGFVSDPLRHPFFIEFVVEKKYNVKRSSEYWAHNYY